MVAVLAACGMGLCGPAVAHAAAFDTFDVSTFNDIDGSGHEIKYTGGVPFVKTVQFDSTAFTLQQNERNPNDVTGCFLGVPGFSFGGRTAWVRFVSGVLGSLKVETTVAGFDAILWVRSGPLRTPGNTAFSELGATDCIDSINPRILGEALGPDRVYPDTVAHIELAGWCGTAQDLQAACPDPTAAPGGPVSLKLTFTPDDQDADGVADTLDACPAVAGISKDGCPDADGDGVSDNQDQCPGIKGDDALGCIKEDADRDGFRTDVAPVDCNDADASIFPGAVEAFNNGKDDNCDGLSATDADGDLYAATPAGKDCNDTDPAISPVAVEVRGNAVDEDCKGGAAPFFRVGTNILLDFFYGHNTRTRRSGFIKPRVIRRPRGSLPAGLIVDVRCKGTGCPFGSRTYKPTPGAGSVALRALDGARLGDRTRVEVRIIVPGRVGRVLSYTMHWRSAKPPTAVVRCMPPGATSPRAC